MTTNKPKLLFVIEQELIDRIDNFRFGNRINFRSEAIRRLLEEALKKYEKPPLKKK
jgi:metal-responsive CopG/Arc/MetJ family transcriptional regulator